MPDPRQIIEQRVSEWGISRAALSRRLGRNDAWLQQYLRRGSPRVLPEAERRILARELDLDERLLGALDPWQPAARPS